MADRRSRRQPPAMEVAGGEQPSVKEETVDDSVMAIDLDVNVEAEVLKLRGRWELASVLNFLNVFEPLFGKSSRISAEEIEKGLIKPDISLAELHITLLKGIPPVSKMLSTPNAWVTVLCKKLAMWWPWVAEGEIPIKAAKGEEISNYKKLDPTNRLLILKALCEIRADQDDAVSYINDCLKDGTQMSCFRKDRFGDGNGTSYWYDGSPFLGYRLYREVIKCETKIKGKSKGNLTLPMFSSQWETMATNLEEFHKVQDNLSCSKIVSEVSVGRIIESDAIPVLEKLQKNKERSLKRRQMKETLSNDLKNSCIVGITRTCRIRTPVSYTFEDYDRAIDDAIRLSKNVSGADKQEQGMHHKHGRKDLISTSEDPDTSMKSDDDSGKSNDSNSDDSGKSNDSNGDDSGKSNDSNGDDSGKGNDSNVDDIESNIEISVDNVDDAYNKDYEDRDESDESDENENGDNSDSDYFDAEGNEEMLHKQIASKFKEYMGKRSKGLDRGSNYPDSDNRKLGAKNRLRQRPILNNALDSVVPDSDDNN